MVVRWSRRGTTRIAEQLAEPITQATGVVSVRYDRRPALVGGVVLAVMAASAVHWGLTAHASSDVLVLIAVGAFVAIEGRNALRRRPVLALDESGMAVSGRFLPWDKVDAIWVDETRGLWGISRHSLALEARELAGLPASPSKLTVPLDPLSMPWNEIVKAIQDRFGKRVAVVEALGESRRRRARARTGRLAPDGSVLPRGQGGMNPRGLVGSEGR